MLQSSIARLDGSLMALNKTSTWEDLNVFSHENVTSCGIDTSRGSAVSKEIPRLVEMPCMEKVFPQRNSANYMRNTVWCHARKCVLKQSCN